MLGSEIYAMAPSESPAQKWRLEKVQTINVGTSPLEIIMTKNVEYVFSVLFFFAFFFFFCLFSDLVN